ncbi:MAG: HD domain-containing protein [Nanoarchaeota archaeon]
MEERQAELLIRRYAPGRAAEIILSHSHLVMEKALSIAGIIPEVDLQFLKVASLLHDIGVSMCHVPEIGCMGDQPYICHGIEGRKIMDVEGYPAIGLVCERHIGVGLRKEDVMSRRLPLPLRDMLPVSMEEKIVCYADLFFTKTPGKELHEKSEDQVLDQLRRYGEEQVERYFALKRAVLAGR